MENNSYRGTVRLMTNYKSNNKKINYANLSIMMMTTTIIIIIIIIIIAVIFK